MMKQLHIMLALCASFLFCTALCFLAPAVSAQTNVEPVMISNEMVEAWMGREAMVDHPAVPDLRQQDNATLHFYYEQKYERRAKDVIKSAENAKQKTVRFLPEKTVEDVHIYLLGNLNTYFKAQNAPGRAPEWAAGLSILRDDVILIRLQTQGTVKIEPERTLAHELNHVALRRFAGNSYFPHWFYEGLAMLATDDWGLNRAETLANASMSGNLLELPAIDHAFGQTGAIVDLAYAQSAHFVSWLAKTYGDDAIQKLIVDTAGGMPFDDAFQNSFERSPHAAYGLWLDAMSKNRSFLASLGSQDAIFFYTSLFAGLALVIALVRRTKSRRARLANMTSDVPVTVLPENLRHFGPFT